MRPIRAVTFDFWNTLMAESPGGLVDPRVKAWAGILEEAGLPVEAVRIARAHQVAFDGYQASWRANRQYRVAEATQAMLAYLELEVPLGVRTRLVDSFHTAGTGTELLLCDGVADSLHRLREGGVSLSIVCDVGLTPSVTLRHHLAERGLLSLFTSWAFSDEVGFYKPAPEIFEFALGGIGVDPLEAAHVGDRRRTDIAGALTLGMMAIRYTGVYDDPDDGPSGDHVLSDYSALPGLLGLG